MVLYVILFSDNLIYERINWISSSDFALNGTDEAQVISENNEFANNLIIHGDTQVAVVNGVNVMEAYREGLLNDEDSDVYGDLVSKDRQYFLVPARYHMLFTFF